MIDTAIRRNGGTATEKDSVTGHEDGAIEHLPLSVTLARRRRLEGRLEGRHGVTSLGGFVETDRRVGELNKQENAHVDPVLDSGFDDDSNPNHDRHGGPELTREDEPQRVVVFGKLVAAVLLEALGGFVGGETFKVESEIV